MKSCQWLLSLFGTFSWAIESKNLFSPVHYNGRSLKETRALQPKMGVDWEKHDQAKHMQMRRVVFPCKERRDPLSFFDVRTIFGLKEGRVRHK